MVNKRGLIGESIGTWLWIILVVGLLFIGGNVYATISSSNEENQAKGVIERLYNVISEIKANEANSFLIYSPKGFYLVPRGNEICICKDVACEESWCRTLGKQIQFDTAYIKINVGTLIITNKPEGYYLESNIIEDQKEEEVNIVADKCFGDLKDIGGNQQLRDSILPAITKAREIALSYNKTLVITSAYRSKEEQNALWIKYKKDPSRVCNPDSTTGICPHMTGCAVDVCFGSLCDGNLARTLNNADTQLLEKIMAQAGFVRYAGEYWHFELGTTRWQTCLAEGKTAC